MKWCSCLSSKWSHNPRKRSVKASGGAITPIPKSWKQGADEEEERQENLQLRSLSSMLRAEDLILGQWPRHPHCKCTALPEGNGKPLVNTMPKTEYENATAYYD